ncbi:MAG: hypothetical protein U0228_37970 [Myxococcaceae bacterium]
MQRLLIIAAVGLSLASSSCRTAPTCSDQARNGGESDVDCGGACTPCEAGKACLEPGDCASGRCLGHVCVTGSCRDGERNGAETDVDCGGGCAPCHPQQGCLVAADCDSKVCAGVTCAPPTCSDGVKNGPESDVDCGGPCGPCKLLAACRGPADCVTNLCVDGTCTEPCGPPYRLCPLGPQLVCIDPRSDQLHCGDCSTPCGPFERCVNSVCQAGCPAPLQMCGQQCVDVQNDVLHCGDCVNSCVQGELCLGGNCVPACSPNQLFCSGECVTPMTDKLHCNGCNQPCPGDSLCSMGTCTAKCNLPNETCDAGAGLPLHCADTRVDVDNCGACGVVCPPAAHAFRLCVQGNCDHTQCQVGFGDCDGIPENGCETPLLANDPTNCGQCGRPCPNPRTCTNGLCL